MDRQFFQTNYVEGLGLERSARPRQLAMHQLRALPPQLPNPPHQRHSRRFNQLLRLRRCHTKASAAPPTWLLPCYSAERQDVRFVPAAGASPHPLTDVKSLDLRFLSRS